MSISARTFVGTSTASQIDVDEVSEPQARECSSDVIRVRTVVGRMRVDIPLSSTQVRVVFDPAAVERARGLEQLNQAMRLGYRPPKSSTK